MSVDLHTHTEASFDSDCTMAQRVALADDAGITTIACTDHNAVHPRLDDRTQMIDGIEVIAGVELFTRGQYGRIDVLGLMIDPAMMRKQVPAEGREKIAYREAIDRIHDAGGVAIMAHPGRYDTDLEAAVQHLLEHGVDGIETAYPYEFVSDPMPYTPHERIVRIAQEYDLLETGGSDCHGTRRQHIGAIRLDEAVLRKLRQRAAMG
ncbi:MAG: PHP domain-containing protein [Candidatus Nanohaloarchaeota archaeon QJJ-5]|nr:PHP domain-containing protein [Candidatus Nanohaloarchaeota archaeon QJJ-5]